MNGSVAPPSESARTAFAEATGMVAWLVVNQSSNERIELAPSGPPAGVALHLVDLGVQGVGGALLLRRRLLEPLPIHDIGGVESPHRDEHHVHARLVDG